MKGVLIRNTSTYKVHGVQRGKIKRKTCIGFSDGVPVYRNGEGMTCIFKSLNLFCSTAYMYVSFVIDMRSITIYSETSLL